MLPRPHSLVGLQRCCHEPARNRPANTTLPEALPALSRWAADYETLVSLYFTRISYLHGTCFYSGIWSSDIGRRAIESDRYIADAQALSAG